MDHLTAQPCTSSHRDSLVTRILAVAAPGYPDVGLTAPASPDRGKLEAHIAKRFASEYGARIDHFLPYLVNLTVAGEPGAVTGLRPARSGTLFLEQYLDSPVEQAISRAEKTPVDRAQVVEIGNLVSAAPGAASLLFGVLPTVLTMAGFRWVVCTATPQVRKMLDKMGFPNRCICTADPAVLGDRRTDWGSYYDSSPQVIVGDARQALTLAESSTTLCEIVRHLHARLESIASALRVVN